MIAPKFNEKMMKELNLDKWKAENNQIEEEFGICGKILLKNISLETIEALVHDALKYKEIYEEVKSVK